MSVGFLKKTHKLTEEQKEEIRKAKGTYQVIGEQFGIHRTMVSMIKAQVDAAPYMKCPKCLSGDWGLVENCMVKCRSCNWEGEYNELALFKNRSFSSSGYGRKRGGGKSV